MLKWINKKRNKKGFTLIELVVVIAILGILAALAIPRLSGSRDHAARTACFANQRTIEGAANIAYAETGEWHSVEELQDVIPVDDVDYGPYLDAKLVCPTTGSDYTMSDTDGVVDECTEHGHYTD